MRFSRTRRLTAQLMKAGSVVALAGLTAGCAGDVMRFSDGFYTNAIPARPPAPVQTPYPSSAPVYSAQPVYQQPAYRQPQVAYPAQPSYTPQPVPGVDPYATGAIARQPATPQAVTRTVMAAPSSPAAQSAAPVLAPRPAPQAPAQTAVAAPAPAPEPAAAAPRAGEGWTKTGGTYVTLRQGETVYNLAKRYGVPANAIMEANGIADASAVQAGQQILIPMYVYGAGVGVSAPDNNKNVQSASSGTGSRTQVQPAAAPLPGARPQSVALAPVASPAPAPVAGGRYTVQPGDTLSAIARRTGTSVAALKTTNNLASDTVRIGQSLIVPGQSGGNLAVPASNGIDPITTATTPAAATKPVASYTPPAAPAGSVASIDAKETASAPAATGIASMRWPANGRIVAGFGSNVGGRPNDGIDISVPRGTPVKAAENGVVIYSGDGLKELGKTVLVRHDNGMVTVYGHLDAANVKRGDNVTRGQTIGASGMSGSAKQPQLHFEVRKETAPVDPMKYLSKS